MWSHFKGDPWRYHRKLLNPSFNYNIVNGFSNLFFQNTKRLVDSLQLHANSGETFDIRDLVKICSMNIIYG